ncbi:DNA replication/repair protein RecF [Marinithermus hydrothermalis]|uniref:DNA replication and repair protein RecF n=1 Tax=Marinithermus hydrothermalis (strain DSM 14884 / JCM 11576 / T1) TaxID=869210 RepID=F2NN40_MARHT|nr:DNA replication and repair protein RecF [Marinithermus hydrothermalis]AEB12779.1 DNA replication and repair protein recF [Marinithermus hydrothermalis DSM 14884]
MRLLRFRQRHFRNLRSSELTLAGGPLAVVGANAQGKTNLLEALYLALGGEVRGALSERVRFGEREAQLFAEAETELGRVRFEHRFGPAGREVKVNEAPASLRELAEYPGAVWVRPEDTALVLGGPEERRRWMDLLLTRFSARYRSLLSAYERALRQRNALLKGQGRLAGLAAWNQKLATYGSEILQLRRRLLTRLEPLAQEAYRELAPGTLELALRETVTPEGYLEALETHLQEELERGATLFGPHRDDLKLLLNGLEAPQFASRGEARAIALALRLAEHRLLWTHHGEAPVLLVDDFTAELDARRRTALLAYAQALPQAILTGTDPPEGLPVVHIEGGVWHT